MSHISSCSDIVSSPRSETFQKENFLAQGFRKDLEKDWIIIDDEYRDRLEGAISHSGAPSMTNDS
jgi:hypothetical protein